MSKYLSLILFFRAFDGTIIYPRVHSLVSLLIFDLGRFSPVYRLRFYEILYIKLFYFFNKVNSKNNIPKILGLFFHAVLLFSKSATNWIWMLDFHLWWSIFTVVLDLNTSPAAYTDKSKVGKQSREFIFHETHAAKRAVLLLTNVQIKHFFGSGLQRICHRSVLTNGAYLHPVPAWSSKEQ